MATRMTAAKAWAAVAASLASLLATRLGLSHLGIEGEIATLIEMAGVALITTAAVYLVPNRPKD